MKRWLNFCIFILLMVNTAFAADLTFVATVSANKTSVNSPIQLSLTMTGSKVDADQVELPAIDGFEARYLGPFQQFSMVNGQTTATKSFIYSLFPQKVGKFQIPAITAKINGQDYQTQPIDVEVVENGADAGQAPADRGVEGKIFSKIVMPKKEFFIGESIPVSIKLYFNVEMQNVGYPQFQNDGFLKGDYHYKQFQEVVDGVQFKVVEFTTELIPTRTGDFTLGPATIEGSLLYQASTNQDPFGGMGGDDFFKGFFSTATYERRPVTVNTDPVMVRILPLPEEGKPAGFSGAVGKFGFEMSASPTDLQAGDPITLRMKITSSGNLKTAEFPDFNNPQFKVYDPQVKEEPNAKSREQVIIPLNETAKEIPAVSFSYFDTELKQYQTITAGPLPITVHPAPPGSSPAPVPATANGGQPAAAAQVHEQLGQDLIFIKERSGTLVPIGFILLTQSWFWLIVIAVIFGTIAAVIFYLRDYRLRTDRSFARRFMAPKEARKGIQETKEAMEGHRSEAFYASLLKTLKSYLGNKLNISGGGLTYMEVERLLAGQPLDPGILKDIKEIFDTADVVRYGATRTDPLVMESHFHKLQTIIDYLERHLK